MQNNTQKRIHDILYAAKRRRKWKIMTVVLSVLVLCNTLYAMQNAAVAISDSNAQAAELQAVVDEALRNSANSQEQTLISAEFTADETQAPPAGTPQQSPAGTASPQGEAGGDGTTLGTSGGNGETTPGETPQSPSEPVSPQGEAGGDGTTPGTPGGSGTSNGNGTTPGTPGGSGTSNGDGTTQGTSGGSGETTPGGSGSLPLEGEVLPAPDGTEETDPEGEEVLGETRPVELVTQESWVGETRIAATYYNNAFETDVTLSARQITEADGAEYEAISALVHEAAAEHEGFTAEDFAVFDITFLDSYGQQVEPLAGALVGVSISTTGKETPDDVAEILHINEHNQVELMQAATDGYTAEFTTDSFSPFITVKTAPTGVAGNITSAYPTFLRVLDAKDNPVAEANYNDMVAVELGWNIRNTYEVTNEGDYVEITLPDGLEFPSGTGNFKLDRAASVGSTTYPAGTEIATYTVSGNKLKITYLEPAVRLITARRIFPAFTLKGDPWGELRFEGVRVTSQSPFRPQIEINGQTAHHSYIINITNRQPVRLAGVTITGLKAGDGIPGSSSYVEFGSQDVIPIEVSWVWRSMTQYIGKGDYYEIALPEGIVFRAEDTTAVDERGNIVRTQVIPEMYYETVGYNQTRARHRATLRVTYEDVVGAYNESSGYFTALASMYEYSIDNADYVYPYGAGKDNYSQYRLPLTASARGGTSSRTIRVLIKRGSLIPDGVWRARSNGTSRSVDFEACENESLFYYMTGPEIEQGASPALFVVADHDGDLEDDPFMIWKPSLGYDVYENASQQAIQYEPFVSNYIDAYCVSPSKAEPAGHGYTNGRTDFSLATQFSLVAPESIIGDEKAEATRNILSISVPYVQKSVMLSALRRQGLISNTDYYYSDLYVTDAMAISAVNIALYNAVHGGGYRITGNSTAVKVINGIADALVKYKRTGGASTATGYRLDGEPVVTVNGTSATVSGKLTPVPVHRSITGTFTNGDGSVSKAVTIDYTTGEFSAQLDGIDPADRFKLHFTGTVEDPSSVNVLYFRNKVAETLGDKAPGVTQDLIAAEIGKKRIEFEWETSGRDLRIIKRFEDAEGNTITPDAEVEITINRYVNGGEREEWKKVYLNKANGYTWFEKGIPLRDANGNYYRYDARETKVPEGFHLIGSSSDTEGRTFVFTFTNQEEEEEKTSVTVIKSFEGLPEGSVKHNSHVVLFRTDAAGNNPERMYVKLANPPSTLSAAGDKVHGAAYSATRMDGYVDAAWTLKDENSWKVTFEGLPKYLADGTTEAHYIFFEDKFDATINNVRRTYRVKEDGTTYYMEDGVEKPADFTVTIDQPDMSQDTPSAVIHNTRKGSLVVIKKWIDQEGGEWTWVFPDAVTAKLSAKKNGVLLTDAELQALIGGQDLKVTLTKANGWTASWANLPMEGMEYFVAEADVETNRNNYELVDPVTLQPIAGQTVPAVRNPETGVFEVTLWNRRKPTEIYLEKRDRESGKLLPGAEFSLYKESDTKNPIDVQVTDANGRLTFKNLSHNVVYVLKETKWPEGYVPRANQDPIIFRIEVSGGSSRIFIISGPDYTSNAYVPDPRNMWMTLVVNNDRVTVVLPEAGGSGTRGYIAGGMSLMTATLLMYVTWQFMCKKGKRGASK